MTPPVLIVGAGPVGLTLALELVRFGIAIRIIDKAPARTDKSKAVCLWSRSLELFARSGIAGDLVASGVEVRAANITTGSREIAHLALDGLDTPYAFALMIPQSETERILETRLSQLGVTIERSTELMSFTAKGDGVGAEIRRSDGWSETVRSEWLVGCDGAHSRVRHALGFSFGGDTVDDEFLLADIVLTGDLPANEMMTFWHRKGVVALFPLPGGRTRLIASLEAIAPPDAPEPELSEVQVLLDERGPGGIVASDPVWIARFRVNERKVDSYRAGRVFLAGDAAHVHSPAGGQGMNTGMQDAFNLAWKLALVLHGETSQRLLDSYSLERSAIAEGVIAESRRLLRVAMVDGRAAQLVRNFVAGHLLGLPPARDAIRRELSELAVAYDKSPLNGTAVGAGKLPRPGHRLPPPSGAPIGGGDRPRFAILAASEGPGLSALGRRQRNLVEDSLRPPADPRSVVLVRPDGYVALIAEAGDWRSVDAYLSALV